MAVDAAGNPILDQASIMSIQNMLGVSATGVWDGATRTAFNGFQSAKGWGLSYGLKDNPAEWGFLISALQSNDRSVVGPPKTGNVDPGVKPTVDPYGPNGGNSGAATAAQDSAKALISEQLHQWGLENLTDWAWDQITKGNANILPTLLRGTEEYKARFAGNATRVAQGYNALSEGQYLQLEDNYRYLMTQYGLPKGFYDSQAEMAKLIGGNVNPDTLNSRLQMYSDAANKAPSEVRTELQRLYGVTDGEMAAFFIDPTQALPMIEQRYNAVGAAASADRAGFSAIAKDTAERLASLGANNSQQTVDQFTKLQRSRELFNPLAGEHIGEQNSAVDQNMTTDQAAIATFGGNATDQEELRRRGEQRAAGAQGGGSFAAKSTGVVGLGSNAT